MRIELFDYELPEELIAQEPAERRDGSRLLHVDRAADGPPHPYRFADLPELLTAGDLLVVNDAMVDPLRLHARRGTGGLVEILLLREIEAGAWEAMVRGGKRLREGERLRCERAPGSDETGATGSGGEAADPIATDREGAARDGSARDGAAPDVTAADDDTRDGAGRAGAELTVGEELADGRRVISLPAGSTVEALTAGYGEMPLPPYIRRRAGDPRTALDHDRYQTVYARNRGAVAAPTAGLHFTRALLRRLEEGGIEVAALTLRVGPGTFQPVRVDDVSRHRMEAEPYVLPPPCVAAIVAARGRGGRVVGVGTTVVRTLEYAACTAGSIGAAAGAGEADIFIYPGFEFRVIDAMLTNFHLPRSTPILMASALAGRERLLRAYEFAVQQRFRFYSYGDAMLIT